jgi:hypothetical protein
MLPPELKPESFNAYHPEAKKLITGYIAALQPLPLSFVPSLLREVIEYDFKFPAERRALERELSNLESLSGAGHGDQQKDWFHDFAQITLSRELLQFDWVNSRISGRRINWMRFVRQRPTMPTVCAPPCRRNRLRFRG